MKKGFTLIEMLIVIGIIGVLSMLSINGYMDFRRSAILDLSADNLISQVEQLKLKARSGDFGSLKIDQINHRIDQKEASLISSDLLCYGFYFLKTDDNKYYAKGFSVPFSNLKTYDVISGSWKFSGCEDFSSRKDFDLNLDSDVYFSSDNLSLQNIVVVFSPPSGDVAVSVDLGLEFGYQDFSFFIKYGESEMRTIIFNVNTSKLTIYR